MWLKVQIFYLEFLPCTENRWNQQYRKVLSIKRRLDFRNQLLALLASIFHQNVKRCFLYLNLIKIETCAQHWNWGLDWPKAAKVFSVWTNLDIRTHPSWELHLWFILSSCELTDVYSKLLDDSYNENSFLVLQIGLLMGQEFKTS